MDGPKASFDVHRDVISMDDFYIIMNNYVDK